MSMTLNKANCYNVWEIYMIIQNLIHFGVFSSRLIFYWCKARGVLQISKAIKAINQELICIRRVNWQSAQILWNGMCSLEAKTFEVEDWRCGCFPLDYFMPEEQQKISLAKPRQRANSRGSHSTAGFLLCISLIATLSACWFFKPKRFAILLPLADSNWNNSLSGYNLFQSNFGIGISLAL